MKTISVLCSVCLMFFCVGCGRVSPPQSPEGSFYPHVYYVKEKTPVSQEKPSKEEAAEQAKDYAESLYD